MPVWEVLNSEQHATLHVSRSADGERHFAQIVADEFLRAAPYYPILFTKHPETGAFYAGAILGLEPGHSMFAVHGALPDYRPADLERQGFFIADGQLVVDREHAAFTGSDGAALFDMEGGAGMSLKRVQHALHMLQVGIPETDAFIRRLLAHGLLDPIDVTMDFDDGEHLRLDGLYTISLDALHALPDVVALELFRRGDLQLVYAQTGSVRHLRTLARMRNDRSVEGVP